MGLGLIWEGGGAYGREESGGGCACEERKGDESR